MPMFQNHAGINITNSKMQLVEVNYSGEEFTIENVDEEYFNEFLDLNAKETKVISILQNAFDEMVMRRPLKSKLVSFTLPHDFFHVVKLPFDSTLVQSDLLEHFKWELSVLYPKISEDEIVAQNIEVESQNNKGKAAIVISTFRKYLKLLNNFCLQNELKLKYIDNVHIASDRVISLINCFTEQEVVLSVYITGSHLSLIFLLNGKPIHFKVIPIANASEIIPRLAEEINVSRELNIDPGFISRSFIAGDNISDSMIEKAKEKLNINFSRFNPFEEIKVNPELFELKAFTERSNSFSSAAGIAYRLV